MAGIQIRREDISGIRAAVGENLRESNAVILSKWTGIILWCLLGCGVSALIGIPLGAIGAILGICCCLYRMKDAARGFARAAWLGAWIAVLAASMVWPNNGVWTVFPIASAALMLAACYSLFRSGDVQRKIAKVTCLVVAGTVLTASMQGENSTVSLLGRGLGIAILLVGLMKCKCIAYAGVMEGFDKGVAKKWREQWKLFRNMVFASTGVFLLSLPLGLPALWALSLVAGGGMLAFLALRELVLLRRTVKICRKYLSAKNMVDSLGL